MRGRDVGVASRSAVDWREMGPVRVAAHPEGWTIETVARWPARAVIVTAPDAYMLSHHNRHAVHGAVLLDGFQRLALLVANPELIEA